MLGNHVKKFMKRRPVDLYHMIDKIAADRLLEAEPKHARAHKIQRHDVTRDANRKTPDRRIDIVLVEDLQILLQVFDFRVRLHAFDAAGRRLGNCRTFGFFRIHDGSSVGGSGRDHRDLRLDHLEAETRGLYHAK